MIALLSFGTLPWLKFFLREFTRPARRHQQKFSPAFGIPRATKFLLVCSLKGGSINSLKTSTKGADMFSISKAQSQQLGKNTDLFRTGHRVSPSHWVQPYPYEDAPQMEINIYLIRFHPTRKNVALALFHAHCCKPPMECQWVRVKTYRYRFVLDLTSRFFQWLYFVFNPPK